MYFMTLHLQIIVNKNKLRLTSLVDSLHVTIQNQNILKVVSVYLQKISIFNN